MTEEKKERKPISKGKARIFKIVIVLFSLVFAFFIAEFSFRIILFSGGEFGKEWRKPGNFADPSEDLFWVLHHRFRMTNPDAYFLGTHPDLGWCYKIDKKTFRHWDHKLIKGRRPVLLYGDSFAQCIDTTQCFEDYLNKDTTFNKDHYFLNHGVGGYGVDQIYWMYKETAGLHKKPFIVFSLLTHDLDRSILKIRDVQKPYYEWADDQLVKRGQPIDTNQQNFLDTCGIGTFSYLWRAFVYNPPESFSPGFVNSLRGYEKQKRRIQWINLKILEKAVADLRAADTEFVFLIFHSDHLIEGENWREPFLKKFLKENNVPHIWSKDLVKENSTPETFESKKYLIPGDGHPTSHFNYLIAQEIKKAVLGS